MFLTLFINNANLAHKTTSTAMLLEDVNVSNAIHQELSIQPTINVNAKLLMEL
jgi:hypothetical protein